MLFNNLFSDCQRVPCLRRYGPTKLRDGAEMAIFLRPVYRPSGVQHVSELHSKFALSHTMCGSMVDIQSATAAISRGKKIEKERRKKIETTGQKYNAPIT